MLKIGRSQGPFLLVSLEPGAITNHPLANRFVGTLRELRFFFLAGACVP